MARLYALRVSECSQALHVSECSHSLHVPECSHALHVSVRVTWRSRSSSSVCRFSCGGVTAAGSNEPVDSSDGQLATRHRTLTCGGCTDCVTSFRYVLDIEGSLTRDLFENQDTLVTAPPPDVGENDSKFTKCGLCCECCYICCFCKWC